MRGEGRGRRGQGGGEGGEGKRGGRERAEKREDNIILDPPQMHVPHMLTHTHATYMKGRKGRRQKGTKEQNGTLEGAKQEVRLSSARVGPSQGSLKQPAVVMGYPEAEIAHPV